MENELTCPLCLLEYTNDNLPKLLTSCGHTYCHKCIKALIQRSTSSDCIRFTVTCPEDSSVIRLKTAQMSAFPTNIALLKVIDAKNNSMSFKDESFDVSKIAKKDELQQDDQTNELVAAINEGIEEKGSFLHSVSGSEKSKKSFEDDNKLKRSGETAAGEYSSENNKPKKDKTNNKKDKDTQLCLLHNKPLQIVCTKDLVKICSKCAIFGEHKGHDFKSIQEIQSKNQDLYKKIIGIFEEKALIIERFTNQSIEHELLKILKNTAKKHKKQITDKYKKLIEEISKSQKQTLNKLDTVISTVQTKIKALLKVDSNIIDKYHKWEEKSFQQIELSEGSAFEGKMEFFFKGQTTLQHGKDIIKSMKEDQQKLLQSVQELISNIGLITNQKQFQTIKTFIQVYDNVKLQREKKQKQIVAPITSNLSVNTHQAAINRKTHELVLQKQNKPMNALSMNEASIIDQQESLLEIDFEEQISYIQIATSRMKTEEVYSNQKQKMKTEAALPTNVDKMKPTLKKTSIALPNNSTLILNKSIDQSKDLNQSLFESKQSKPLTMAALKKKVKMIKVPQKYEKVIEQIIQDSSDTIDLTNAELGDVTITQICQLIKSSSKAKTVKLIRNKLSDEVLNKIIGYLPSVITLNLSQNNFSQNALSFLIDHRNELPALKSVILSQNKIVERKHKILLDKLRKLDLIVSI